MLVDSGPVKSEVHAVYIVLFLDEAAQVQCFYCEQTWL